jgi:iron complex outermembrane recepter protein
VVIKEMKKSLLLPAIVFTFQSINLAQQIKIDSTYYLLDSIIVTADRYQQPTYQIPFSLDVIGPDILSADHPNLSSQSIFNLVPGVIVNNRYNLSEGDRISIRGIGTRSQFGVRGIKILLDGIPLTFADGQSELNNLDLSTIGRIEVIRGPSSFLYGNAAGGVINIQSKEAVSNKLELNPVYNVGSFGYQKFSLNAYDKIGSNALSINFNRMKYNGFRENSAASTTALNIISKQYFGKRLIVEGIFNYYDAPYLLNPSSLTKSDAENNPAQARTYVEQQGAGKKIHQGQAGINISYQPDTTQKIEATFYGVLRSMLNPLPGDYVKLDRVSGGIRSDYSKKFNLSSWNFSYLGGVDFEFQNDLRHEYDNNGVQDYASLSADEIIDNVQLGAVQIDQREKVNGLGIFSKLGFSPLENVFFTLGLRYDKYDFGVDDYLKLNGIDNSGFERMNNLSEMAGVSYHPDKSMQFYANFSTAFQTPTTTELGNSPSGQGGFNPELKPEQIKNFEVGTRGVLIRQNLLYSISIYRLIVDNMEISYQLPNSQSDVVYYKNSGGAINNGAEVSLTWMPLTQWNIDASFAFMDFKFRNFIETDLINNSYESFQIGGNRVPGVPQEKFSLGTSYNFIFGLIANLFLNWNGKYFVNDINGPEPGDSQDQADYINDAFFTADFKCDYNLAANFGDFDFFFGISNLLNTKYNGSIIPNAAADRFFEPAAPRNWYTGLSINFN